MKPGPAVVGMGGVDTAVDLPLRKGSVIAKALEQAEFALCRSLRDAMRVYLKRLHEGSDRPISESGEVEGPAEVRGRMERLIAHITEIEQKARTEWNAALAEFDRNRRELEAWTTAAQAATRIAGK